MIEILSSFEFKNKRVGISKNQRHKLFEKLSKIHCNLNVKVGGTELELVIIKNLVEFSGGKIGCEAT